MWNPKLGTTQIKESTPRLTFDTKKATPSFWRKILINYFITQANSKTILNLLFLK